MEHQTEIVLTILGIVFVHGLIFYLICWKCRSNSRYRYSSDVKRRSQIYGKHVLVTGGSSGIGLWVAVECARLGADVTIVARNVEQLEKAKQQLDSCKLVPEQKINFRSIDLTKSYEIVEQGLQEIELAVQPIYMLINCAGMAVCGTIEDTTLEQAKQMMDINYFATFSPTRFVLPKMKRAKEGIIVITASQAALVGLYGYGAYGASKFALRGLAETIAMEAKHCGVSVTLALPADTDTPGLARENESKPLETKIISGSGGLAKPEDVGRKIVHDALNGSFFSVLGMESWVLSTMCVGMAPWKGPIICLLQFYLLGPLRLVGLLIQWNFQRIIKNCAKDREKIKDD
ncbi:3-ketodihydrosphingosine reductase [Sabethes cyaneus]|uniref:3-ketodihydrosphingosine reductase n=1 Tax=Sabethes cyaneus TaxID=53552 RepID=UPI00237DEE3C|nr:3-ketodihydrosphingosine reductase [Sabethes cyaneus]XP_053695445.1 3-ketodihydrosphingosine reductase [Sabethes cyaneus]